MGEVRTKVKLTNATNDVLVRRGKLSQDEVEVIEADALIDTGAVCSVLPQFIADQLGLVRVFRKVAEFADGRKQEVDVTEPVLIEILDRKVYEECLVLGDEILIGQTVLEKTDLHVDCLSRKLLPNPAHPNQPVIKIK